MRKVVLVSACLVGFNCKYNGGNNSCELIEEAFKRGVIIPVCPEQLGGLPTPRPPAKITNGDGHLVLKGEAKVKTVDGSNLDFTYNFIRGAKETLAAALKLRPILKCCILKEKSPSCGVNFIYDFNSDSLKEGKGVAAALLSENGFKILSSDDKEEIEKILKEL
ncbi:DUF523 domain-containing protein [Thermovibrio sp.]